MSVAEQSKEVVELAVGYTKQMIDALTPIAKQAYEIGLVTLQIDAAMWLIIGYLGLFFSIFYVTTFKRVWKYGDDAAKETKNSDNERTVFACMYICIGGAVAVIAFCAAVINCLNLWLYVKLFSPELWLAHQVVEKLIK